MDTFIQSGSVISPWYDSMIAKIIVHAADRKSAVSKMKDALNGTTIEGIRTNLSFLSGIMDDEKYQNGDVNTGFIEYYLSDRESTVV